MPKKRKLAHGLLRKVKMRQRRGERTDAEAVNEQHREALHSQKPSAKCDEQQMERQREEEEQERRNESDERVRKTDREHNGKRRENEHTASRSAQRTQSRGAMQETRITEGTATRTACPGLRPRCDV